MTDCATQRMRFETPTPSALEAAFDGGRITSDGGLVWLAKMDEELGLCEGISEHAAGVAKQKRASLPPSRSSASASFR